MSSLHPNLSWHRMLHGCLLVWTVMWRVTLLQGAGIRFQLEGGDGSSLPPNAQLEVYTTRPDTVTKT